METQAETKKYYRTEIKIVVLSEEAGEMISESTCDLKDIAYAISEGDCSGEWEVTQVTELTPAEMAKALIEQGSDPEFFGLNEDGSPADEDGEF